MKIYKIREVHKNFPFYNIKIIKSHTKIEKNVKFEKNLNFFELFIIEMQSCFVL